MTKIPLANNTISNSEIDLLIDWLKGYPRLTKGEVTEQFEKKWSEYIGCEYSVFVNSGSSANLLMVYTLIEMGILRMGDSVVVPSLSWATSLAPFVQFGLNPILCDCNLDDLSIDLDHFQKIIKEVKPKCLLIVPILGFVPEMTEIRKICFNNKIILIEDACESLGSEYKGTKLGNFGLMSSFSTYFGHHISTIEGGMICTNDRDVSNMLRSLRSHGWSRDMDQDYAQKLKSEHNIGDFNELYTFYYNGFNLRSTDLQAFLGINQLEKLPSIVSKRNENYLSYRELINENNWKTKDRDDSFISNFAYPIISDNRDNLIKDLKDNGIECRPMLSGSLARQPYWYKKHGKANLPNCDIIHDKGIYVPNNHELKLCDIKLITDIVNRN